MKIQSLQDVCVLNDGTKIPWVGLGTYKSPSGKVTVDTVLKALELGYRHIDTAAIYGNEVDVGKAIKLSGLKRKEIFVTTKLWNDDQGFESVKVACHKSLQNLGLDYLDLYLIHWPQPKTRLDSWFALVELKKEKWVRSIGVSNYTERHLLELFEKSEEKPSVNQVEFSPFLYQKELLGFCEKHSISLQAYSPLTKGEKLNHPSLKKIAQSHKKTPAQVLLRWALDLKMIILPKTNHIDRLRENIELFDFELSLEDHKEIASLHVGYRTSWDPTTLIG